MESEKTGSVYALLIGMPVGLAFSYAALFASSFFPFNLLLKLAGFKIFWHPLSWLVILSVLAYSLWQTGKKIPYNLRKSNTVKTSLLFTFYANIKVFITITTIYLVGAIADWLSKGDASFVAVIPYGILVMILLFLVATLITAFTISLLIVELTKNKLKLNITLQE
jgi:hypothetical protein